MDKLFLFNLLFNLIYFILQEMQMFIINLFALYNYFLDI